MTRRPRDLTEVLGSLPVLAVGVLVVTLIDFAAYDPSRGFARYWIAPAAMVALAMHARVDDRLDRRRLATIMSLTGAAYFALGVAFRFPVLLMARMTVVNVALVSLGYLAYWRLVPHNKDRFPAGPGAIVSIAGLVVALCGLSLLLGGYPDSILFEADGHRQTPVASYVHLVTNSLFTLLIVVTVFYPPPRGHCPIRYRRSIPIGLPLALIAPLLPYLLPHFNTQWLVLLAAVWTGLVASPRALGLAIVYVAVVPTTFAVSPYSQVASPDELPRRLFLEILLALSSTLATIIVSLREQLGRAQAASVAAIAQEEARARLLRSVIEAMDDAVAILDAQGRMVVSNPAARAMLGAPVRLGEEIAVPAAHVLRTLDGAALDPTQLRAAVNPGGPRQGALTMVNPGVDGRPDQYLDLTVRDIAQAGQRYRIAMATDVTATYARRRELESFAGSVAHDLKNPLASMALWVDLAAADAAHDRESGLAAVSRALESGERMTRLIDDYLAYTVTREGELHWETVDLADVVAGVLGVYAGTDVAADVRVSATVRGDRALLDQLLANLVNNAVKYARPGTAPHVAIRTVGAGAPGWVRVIVADRGIGLGDQDPAALFRPFTRAARGAVAHQGIGLGLALCHAVVTRHGGTIEAHANDWGGATFELTLPLADALLEGEG